MERKKRKEVTSEMIKIVKTMVESGRKINEMALITGYSIRTIQRIIQKQLNPESFIASGIKRKNTCTLRNSVLGGAEQIIFNSVACNNSLTLKEIKLNLIEQLNLSISTPTLHRKLKKMNISRKRLSLIPAERNTPEKIENRAIYSFELSRINKENLVFLDETGFSLHSTRSFGYSPVNTKAYLTVPANRGVNRSLICAININGIVAYEIKPGGFNTESFVEFINNKLSLYFNNNNSSILVLDNAPFHKSGAVLAALRINNIPYKFLVPYLPQLNPIEEFFSMIRGIMKEKMNIQI